MYGDFKWQFYKIAHKKTYKAAVRETKRIKERENELEGKRNWKRMKFMNKEKKSKEEWIS